jgi:hypothetical protein
MDPGSVSGSGHRIAHAVTFISRYSGCKGNFGRRSCRGKELQEFRSCRSYRMKNANHAAGADFSEAVFSLEYGHLFPIGSGTGKKLQEFRSCRSYRIKMGIMPRALFSETRSFSWSTAVFFQLAAERAADFIRRRKASNSVTPELLQLLLQASISGLI